MTSPLDHKTKTSFWKLNKYNCSFEDIMATNLKQRRKGDNITPLMLMLKDMGGLGAGAGGGWRMDKQKILQIAQASNLKERDREDRTALHYLLQYHQDYLGLAEPEFLEILDKSGLNFQKQGQVKDRFLLQELCMLHKKQSSEGMGNSACRAGKLALDTIIASRSELDMENWNHQNGLHHICAYYPEILPGLVKIMDLEPTISTPTKNNAAPLDFGPLARIYYEKGLLEKNWLKQAMPMTKPKVL